MFKRVFVTTAFVLTAASGASAQNWDAPSFFSPRPMDDVGLYVFKTDTFDDPTGLKVIWRQTGNLNLGVHAGIASFDDPGETILLGGEFYGPLTSIASTTGLAVSWGLGAGAVFGDNYITLNVPLGVSVGASLGNGRFLPYVHPRVSFDLITFDDAFGEEQTESEVGFSVDLGVDVNLGERFVVRAGGSFADRDAFGIGVAMRTPRRVVAR